MADKKARTKKAEVKKAAAPKETKKAEVKKVEAPEKKTGGFQGVGIIASIVEIIKAGPVTLAQIKEQLAERFPDRSPESMGGTVVAQCGGKQRPLRIERERKVTLKIDGEGADRKFSL